MEEKEQIQEQKQEQGPKFLTFLKSKANWLYAIGLAIVVWLGCLVRTRNLDLLKDVTTGKYIPLALDPFYFLRLAETILEKDALPAIDNMRYLAAQVGFTPEILPQVLVWLYKFLNFFNKEITLNYVDVIYPVIFFAAGLVVFFFLIKRLTASKSIALIAAALLAVIPTYLYRTTAGFADHEPIGMFFFFLTFYLFVLSWDLAEKRRNLGLALALAAGLSTALTYLSWGGVLKFVLLIIPSATLAAFFLNKVNKKIFLNYALWTLSAAFFIALFTNLIALKFLLSDSNNLLFLVVFSILLVNFIIFKTKLRNKESVTKLEKKLPHQITSFLIVLVTGLLLASLFGGAGFVLNKLGEIKTKLLHPFGVERVALTVQEQQQPFFTDWKGHFGLTFFWLFFFGAVLLFYEAVKHIKKYRYWLVGLFTLFLLAFIFSRYSSGHILNGTSTLSQLLYFGSVIVFVLVLIVLYLYTYSKERDVFEQWRKINFGYLFILVWFLWLVIGARGAIRIFFVFGPITCVLVAFLAVKITKYAIKSKDELGKILVWCVAAVIVIATIYSGISFYKTSYASVYAPSANVQWQKAMAWVRENTAEGEIFAHWWDYGYWVQYFGERPSVTDGGHAIGFWDHLLGRHLLCAQNETEALTYLKTHNASYFLIDPTDIGKYPAYSSIGADENYDRYSWIGTFLLDEAATRETRNETVYVYKGSTLLDDDFIWQGQIFPKQQAGIGAFLLPLQKVTVGNETITTIGQPKAILVYRDKQVQVPLKYAYLDKLYEFEGKSLGGSIYIMPSVTQKLNNLGAALYISEEGMKTMWVKLYLLNQKTENFKLVHAEQDPAIANLRSAYNLTISDIAYVRGTRGPIKIWSISYPAEIESNPDWLKTEGSYNE